MVSWAKLSNRTYIWNYVTNFCHYVAPFPDWHVLVPNLRYFAQHGVKGVFEEGTYSTRGGDLVQLKDYLMARALWDPTVDDQALIAGFVSGYYAEAGPLIKEYMLAIEAGISDSGYYMHECFEVDAPFLTPKLLLSAASAMTAAGKAVALSDERFVRRVDEAGMAVMYVALFRWDELTAFAASEALPWPYNATKRPQFDEFKRRYEQVGITMLDENGHDIEWMEEALFGPRPLPLPTSGALSTAAASSGPVSSTHQPRSTHSRRDR